MKGKREHSRRGLSNLQEIAQASQAVQRPLHDLIIPPVALHRPLHRLHVQRLRMRSPLVTQPPRLVFDGVHVHRWHEVRARTSLGKPGVNEHQTVMRGALQVVLCHQVRFLRKHKPTSLTNSAVTL